MTRPRCLITGSCYGLGLALKHEFSKDFDIIEYDLALGQDLNLESVRHQLIEDLGHCQLFFNNSQAYQVELLEQSHALQNDLAIVNSSSAIDYYTLDAELLDPSWSTYRTQKTLLNQRIRELHDQQAQGVGTRSWIVNLRLTWVDTPQHQDRHVNKLDPGDIAGYVHHLLGCWPSISVQDVLLTSFPTPSEIKPWINANV